MDVRVIDIAIPRSINPGAVKSAYRKTKKLITTEHYNLIHCHSPVGGAICRLAAKGERKKGTKVIYTAHGFHFYDGAPLKNWMIFYPVEKWLSKFTDVLITINQEDYKRAGRKFQAKQTVYVPGIGVDTEKFAPCQSKRVKIREELGLKNSQIMILSVGELNENKNHESVVRAIAGLNLTYVIVGKGELKEKLESTAKECGVDLRLMGFCTNVSDFYDAADVYILPSIREGLNVSLMEAMASGLPVACGKIRGNTDLIDHPLFDPLNIKEIKEAITTAIENKDDLGQKNLKKIRSFDLKTVENITSQIFMGGGYLQLINLLHWQEKRTELGIPLEAKLLISVGELSVRKNHKVVVEALNEIDNPETYYIIVGRGNLKEELESADQTGRLKLLGFRTDIVDLLHCSDLFVFPSLQEGLPVALMEAMASGLQCIASRIRGNTDLMEGQYHGNLFSASDLDETVRIVRTAIMNKNINLKVRHEINMHDYDTKAINKKMSDIYSLFRDN